MKQRPDIKHFIIKFHTSHFGQQDHAPKSEPTGINMENRGRFEQRTSIVCTNHEFKWRVHAVRMKDNWISFKILIDKHINKISSQK